MNSCCEKTTIDDSPKWEVKEAVIPPSFGRRRVEENRSSAEQPEDLKEKSFPRPSCAEDVI